VKLPHLHEWNDARRQLAAGYTRLLEDHSEIVTPWIHPECAHVFYVYVIQVPHRDRILSELHAAGIDALVHYPVPLHHQPAYRHLSIDPAALPVTNRAASRILSLPLYPELLFSQVSEIAGRLIQALEKEK
jgi:dTDP-4-amino-4,6-dideoxygalactose transaminase